MTVVLRVRGAGVEAAGETPLDAADDIAGEAAPEARGEVDGGLALRDDAIVTASRMLREGKLVAFPTETVYGLGARVGDVTAVGRIFVAKGRPGRVPLIVHVASLEQALEYVTGYSSQALAWAKAYWPGPLTLVAERSTRVADVVTGGGDLVGVRVPSHPVALALIEALGEGIAAPSANLYDQLPPVRAQHVLQGLEGRIDAVLDGGMCPGGLESTVINVAQSPARVLRTGAISAAQLGENVLLSTGGLANGVVEASQDGWLRVGEAREFATWHRTVDALRVGRLVLQGQVLQNQGGQGQAVQCDADVVLVRMPNDARGYGARLYDVLHDLRDAGCQRVWVDALPHEGDWQGVWDRVHRLSHLRVARVGAKGA